MKCFLFRLLFAVIVGLPFAAAAQDTGARYLQIEAHRDRATALSRAGEFADRVEGVAVFEAPGGWNAITVGPFADTEVARDALRGLRAAGRIPGDSFLTVRGDYGGQVWSGSGNVAQALATPTPAVPGPSSPAVAAPAPAEPLETLADARAAERALSRAEREDIQRALAWDGHYDAAIDGAFGRGTRAAIASWQAAAGVEPTGVLRSRERATLVAHWQAERARLGLQEVTEAAAGIRLTLPMGLVTRTATEPPFIRYEGSDGVTVLLFSQPGDALTLAAWFNILQTLEVIPLDGPRNLAERSFTIEGRDADRAADARAILSDGWVKGFVVAWPRSADTLMARVTGVMRDSFVPLGDVGLPRVAGPVRGDDLMAGVAIRQPARTATGVFVDAGGHVLTLAETVAGCARVTVDHETDATIAAASGPFALLRPQVPLSPMAVAVPGPMPGRGDPVLAAGYPWGGRLATPSVNGGSIVSPDQLSGLWGAMLVGMEVAPGEAGAPLLAADGRLAGVLVGTSGPRSLPPGVAMARSAPEIEAFLAGAGIRPGAAPAPPEGDMALAERARGMATLVSCWN